MSRDDARCLQHSEHVHDASSPIAAREETSPILQPANATLASTAPAALAAISPSATRQPSLVTVTHLQLRTPRPDDPSSNAAAAAAADGALGAAASRGSLDSTQPPSRTGGMRRSALKSPGEITCKPELQFAVSLQRLAAQLQRSGSLTPSPCIPILVFLCAEALDSPVTGGAKKKRTKVSLHESQNITHAFDTETADNVEDNADGGGGAARMPSALEFLQAQAHGGKAAAVESAGALVPPAQIQQLGAAAPAPAIDFAQADRAVPAPSLMEFLNAAKKGVSAAAAAGADEDTALAAGDHLMLCWRAAT